MLNIFKAVFVRIVKNIFYIAGLVIAAVVTYLFTGGTYTIGFLDGKSANDIAVFVSGAMIFFLTIFVPILLGVEYSDGTFRNKLIAGHTQTDVYMGTLMGVTAATWIMVVVWLVSGIIGGVRPDVRFTVHAIEILAFLTALNSFLVMLGIRIKKQFTSSLTAIGILYLSFNGILFGNFLMMDATGAWLKISKILYNIPAMGQWFSSTCFYEDILEPSLAVKVMISLVIVAVTSFLGMFRLNGRDVD